MLQRDIFLDSEADAWLLRNHKALADPEFAKSDPVIAAVTEIALAGTSGPPHAPLRICEVGCSEGHRLAWLRDSLGANVHGVEPSAAAVKLAAGRGLDVKRGTADALPFADETFDILVFGFCLYLCDRRDLFRIAQEADRVLKRQGWIIILDFHSKTPLRREYHHRPGVWTYKMDYRRLFDWHPAYTCYAHRIVHHASGGFTDEPQEWVATSVLRRNPDACE